MLRYLQSTRSHSFVGYFTYSGELDQQQEKQLITAALGPVSSLDKSAGELS